VYILRASGKVIMGPMTNDEHLKLSDATWNEKLAAGLLLLGIVAMGVAPFWLYDLIEPGSAAIMKQLTGM
jgi:NADH-quinone oxidoreductase subunit M